MDVKLPPEWLALLAPEFTKPYFKELAEFVRAEYTAAWERKGPPIYPAARNIFRALDRCLPDAVKVVIIGQDPYHGAGQADGLSFSVPDGVPLPPSLRNIYKEASIGRPGGCLDRWADQGVLLLNASLTVRDGQPGSHADAGWQTFTDAVVDAVARYRQGVVYLLWGAFAQRKGGAIDPSRNLILRAPHPSPLSAHRGFFGCGHFARANEYLLRTGKDPIIW